MSEAIMTIRIMTSMVVARKTTKAGPLTTVVRMAAAMRRTMAEAIVTLRIVRLIGGDEENDGRDDASRRCLRSVTPRARGPSRARAVTAAA